MKAGVVGGESPPLDARSEEREARRRGLLEAAIRAIGVHGPTASMEQIAAEAGITKPILYRHFGDKRGLTIALTVDYLGQLGAALAQVEAADLRELTRGQLDAGLRFLETRPGLFEFILNQGGFELSKPEDGGSHFDNFVRFFEGILAERGLPADAAAPWAHGLGALFGGSVRWWLQTRTMPRERFVELIVSLLWDGLGTLLESPTEPVEPKAD